MNILDIRGHHAHLAPVASVGEGLADAIFLRVIQEIKERTLLPVVVVRHHLQIAHDPVAGVRVSVGQLDHIFTIIAVRLPLLGFDDDRAIGAIGFLKTRVTVKPVGPVLHDREPVRERLARRDPWIADSRHAVLLVGQDKAVPMHRCVFGKVVGHVDRDILTLLETKGRPRR